MRHYLLEKPSPPERVLLPIIVALAALSILVGVFFRVEAMEVLSVVFLLMISLVSLGIFDLRRIPGNPVYRGAERIWLLMAIGFLYLALDEALSFHENLDRIIHWAFSIEETELTDRLDDVIVAIYGIAGLAIIYLHRVEFWQLLGYLKFFAAGFALLFAMVLLDATGNRPNVLLPFGVAESSLPTIKEWLGLGEELLKLLAEIAFLIGFLRLYGQIGEERKGANTPVDLYRLAP